MPVQKLTDAGVLTLCCPEGRSHCEVFDTLIRGLYVDVMANGRLAYRVRYRWEGKQRVLTLGDARLLTIDEARTAARAALRRAMAGENPRLERLPEHGPTIATFYREHYLPYVKSYKRSWNTDETMIRLHVVPALGERAMGSVIPPDIARLIETMRERGYAAGTCNRALILLSYGYTLALRWGVEGVEQNPAKALRELKEDNRIERYLTNEQTQRLLVAVNESHNPLLASIVAFLIYTGARRREVLDARWDDVDMVRKLWRIPKTKSGKVRHVPLSKGAWQLLSALRAEGVPLNGCVFANPRTGLPFVSIFHSWDAARQRAGLPELRLHDLRHSFASFLVNAGRSLYEVQELLGHADIRTTARYAHLSRERLFEAVEAVPVMTMQSE
ncbi:integrase [Vreelandella aquamarina]|jgi:integrase|uniref:Integrase n=1 Tax=Vreelandella aquamarina TaxID=77097 RepID=A0A6F8XCF3_9GAMM|nr:MULTISPECIES: site-specific integrase [Halomonas]PHR00438.1 MAG: integrase [Halomonas sp.]BCB70767.1 integrase [Halomonas meridiana]|tara:strand:- start:9694 stop:10854 length:1161 start_codon:yes stop_codon:yes gene_type:complete